MEAVIWVVSAIGAEAGSAALIMYAVEIGTAIYYTAIVATAYSYQQRQKRKARDQYNASQVDRLTNVVTTTGPRELVLGRVRKGGYILFRDSCGYYKERFVMVVALAAHEIEGVDAWYLNDKQVTLDASGYVIDSPYDLTATETVTVDGHVVPAPIEAISGTVSYTFISDENGSSAVTVYQKLSSSDSKARIRLYKGTQTQTADARLMELFPNVWTSAHRLQGIAYAIVEFTFDETAFPSGLPNLTAVIKGAKVYDPRSGLTVWSENPALHMLHILQHPYFGKRASVTATELSRISAAANACDEAYTPLGASSPVALYRSAIVQPFGGQAADAFDDICTAMCGSWAYAGGEFHVKAGKYTAPVIELTEDDLMTSQADLSGSSTAKSVTINTHRARADKINTVNVKIYDADADYKETPLPPVKNSTAIAKDGRELATDLTLPAVGSGAQGKVVANYMLKESFDALSVSASFKLKAYQVELFDNIYLTLPRYGWNSKVFTVNGKKFDATGVVELSLRETSAELFNPLIASNSSGFASNTGLVEPWSIPKPANLVTSSGTSELVLQADGTVLTRVKVQWTSITDARITQGGFVEVQWQEVGASSWNSVIVTGSESACHLLGTVDGRNIIVRARSKYALAVSDWSVQVVHTVVGKTEPPNSVVNFRAVVENQNLTLRWDSNPEVDIAGYEIRLSDSAWGQSGELYRGSSTNVFVTTIADANIWYIKAFDRSGNYSITAKSLTFNVSAVPVPTSGTASVTSEILTISWGVVATEFTLAGYEVRNEDFGWGASGEVFRGLANTTQVKPSSAGVAKTWYVRAYDILGNYSASSLTIAYTKPVVGSPSPVNNSVADKLLRLSWAGVTPLFGLSGYEVRDTDSSWGSSGEVYRGLNTSINVKPVAGKTWYVRTVDKLGDYSTTASTTYTYPAVSEVSSVTHTFADTSLTSATVTLSWTDSSPDFGLDYYEISFDNTVLTAKSSTITLEANWIGNRTVVIKTVDLFAQKSSGVSYPITKLIPNSATNFRAQVIDNNVLLYWNLPARTSLPISHILLKQGDSWDTATTIGTKAGEFTSISELAGGRLTYWIAVVDTDNYQSIPVSLTTVVSQPPDFIFYGTKTSVYAGTKTNARLEYDSGTADNRLILPVNLTETFDSHFSTRTWTSPSSQVSAGFPVFIQPGASTGSYEEVFDFLTVIGSSNVTCSYTGTVISGSPTVSYTISVSLDGSTWADYPGFSTVFVTNFRYVKFKLSVTQTSSGDLFGFSDLVVRLDSKLKSDSGVTNAVSTDASGTIVNFGSEFVDVISITPAVNSTVNRSVVYDFLDLLIAGTYTLSSGIATVSAVGHNLQVGQKVRLTPSSGLLPIGVYTVTSVIDSSSYTVSSVVSGPSSGNLASYPNSFRVYVYDTAGNRQSNTVSWTVRGS